MCGLLGPLAARRARCSAAALTTSYFGILLMQCIGLGARASLGAALRAAANCNAAAAAEGAQLATHSGAAQAASPQRPHGSRGAAACCSCCEPAPLRSSKAAAAHEEPLPLCWLGSPPQRAPCIHGEIGLKSQAKRHLRRGRLALRRETLANDGGARRPKPARCRARCRGSQPCPLGRSSGQVVRRLAHLVRGCRLPPLCAVSTCREGESGVRRGKVHKSRKWRALSESAGGCVADRAPTRPKVGRGASPPQIRARAPAQGDWEFNFSWWLRQRRGRALQGREGHQPRA